MRVLKLAGAAALLVSMAACASTTSAPMPAPALAGETLFQGNCSGCHSGAGRAPSRATLAAMTPNFIVEALTTGKMMRQGSALSADDKKAVATFLTGKAPV